MTPPAPKPPAPAVESLPTLTVGDVASASGVAGSAVRFYERHGIVTAARTTANHRLFDDSAACRIKVAKLAQAVGMTVREIAELLDPLPPEPTPEDWARIASELVQEAERRYQALTAYLEEISIGVDLCRLADNMPRSATLR